MEDKRFSRINYLNVVQLEYISNLIRVLTYSRPEDVKKYGDICKMKKEKIVNVAFKESMGSIFTSKKVLEKNIDLVLKESGIPKFKYRDDSQKKRLGYWDRFYFFKEGMDVLFENEIWSIKKNIIKSNVVEIENKNSLEIIIVPHNKVKVLLKEKIINHFI